MFLCPSPFIIAFLVVVLYGESRVTIAQAPQWKDNSYGSVDFITSCEPTTKDDFNKALSMLYSFWYGNSLSLFQEVVAQDPRCCIAYHMAALTYQHPIWDFISDSRLQQAADYADQAKECMNTGGASVITAREKAYIESLLVFTDMTNPDLVSSPTARLEAYAQSLKDKVYIPYVEEDLNAGIFYGFGTLAVGFYSENEPSNGWPNLKLAGLIEESMVLRDGLSPGALHYVIHSYDQPAFASRALSVANIYENSSISVPHALHMPSHIYNDLGLWSQAIKSNVLSLNTAYQNAQSSSNGKQRTTNDWYHGSYFLQFEMLQKAMDCDADAFLNQVFKQDLQYNDEKFFSSLEAVVRVGAHFLIETREWKQGTTFDKLEQFYAQSTPEIWDGSIWTRIYANFVATVSRAILNYPANEVISACDAIDAANKTLVDDPGWKKYQLPYWRMSFEIMVRSAKAWKEFRTISMANGIEMMQAVVNFQMSTWAPEVGHIWEPNEQLAEMYMIRSRSHTSGNSKDQNKARMQDYKLALESYEQSLSIYPNRYHSLAGAGNCAELLSDTVKASYYYGLLITLTSGPFPDVKLDGFTWPTCPSYKTDRRPAISMASEYFKVIDLANSCEDNSLSLTMLVLLIVSIAVMGVGMGWLSYKFFIMQNERSKKYYSLLHRDESMDILDA